MYNISDPDFILGFVKTAQPYFVPEPITPASTGVWGENITRGSSALLPAAYIAIIMHALAKTRRKSQIKQDRVRLPFED